MVDNGIAFNTLVNQDHVHLKHTVVIVNESLREGLTFLLYIFKTFALVTSIMNNQGQRLPKKIIKRIEGIWDMKTTFSA